MHNPTVTANKHGLFAMIVCAWVLGLTGCGQTTTRINLTTFDEAGTPQHHYAEFRRASYQQSQDSTVEFVLRDERPSSIDPTQTITQIVYIKGFWHPQPGKTYANATQINAHVQYAMLTPPTGVRYDGGAFISYEINRKGQLVGQIESGDLMPKYRMGDAVEPFGPARFSGTFIADKNPADVVNTLQMLDAQFSRPIEQ